MHRTWQTAHAAAIALIAATLALGDADTPSAGLQQPQAPPVIPAITTPSGAQAVEQTSPGTRPPATLVESFDGLGAGFSGPQGTARVRNPSDNSLAVGPDHIVQIVNSRMAIYSRKGRRFDRTGQVLYGPVATNNVFRGFGGTCEAVNNGDAVVRYDQVAGRWLIVMPIFRRAATRPDQPGTWKADGHAYLSPPGRPAQPGPAVPLFQPPPAAPTPEPGRQGATGRGGQPNQPPAAGSRGPEAPQGSYSMCYAVYLKKDATGYSTRIGAFRLPGCR